MGLIRKCPLAAGLLGFSEGFGCSFLGRLIRLRIRFSKGTLACRLARLTQGFGCPFPGRLIRLLVWNRLVYLTTTIGFRLACGCFARLFFLDCGGGYCLLYAAMKGYELVGARGATWTLNGKTLLAGPWWPGRYDPEVGGSATLAAGYKLLLSRLMLDAVLPILREHKPNLAVINLGSADYVAHSFGPSSPYYRETLEYLDVLLGELLRALEEVGIRDRSTLIISSDHGFSDVNSERVVAPPLGLLGAVPLSDAVFTAPVVAGGRIYAPWTGRPPTKPHR